MAKRDYDHKIENLARLTKNVCVKNYYEIVVLTDSIYFQERTPAVEQKLCLHQSEGSIQHHAWRCAWFGKGSN